VWLRAHGLLPLDTAGAVIVGGAASLVPAALSWVVLERPAIAWARRRGRARRERADGRFPLPTTG
jgi:peptidoglycan/LPS O-acetylase OafA/YrhL